MEVGDELLFAEASVEVHPSRQDGDGDDDSFDGDNSDFTIVSMGKH